MSDLQTPVNRRRDGENGKDDDDGNPIGTTEPQPETNLLREENTDKGQRDKRKTSPEYHPNDTERRTVMPNAATFTSAFEDSFRLGSIDSMVLYHYGILIEL